MDSVWKRLFIGATILLVICAVLGVSLWFQLSDAEKRLDYVEIQLSNAVAVLDTTRDQLADTKTLLDTTETQLVDTEAQLGTTKAQLDATKTQLDMTERRLETEENKNSQMLNQYASLKSQVNVRLGVMSQFSCKNS